MLSQPKKLLWPLFLSIVHNQIKASSEIKRHKTLVTCLLPSFYPLIAAAVCQGPGQGGQMRSPGDNRELIPATNIIYNQPLSPLSPQYLIGDHRITTGWPRLGSHLDMDTLEEQTRDTGTILTSVCTNLDTSWGVFSVFLTVPLKTINFIFLSVIVSIYYNL